MLCRHYVISGRVQGVFFRASTRDQAEDIGVSGWVRNLSDGRVEVVACGEDQQLDRLEVWLRQGPPMAAVSNIKRDNWAEAPGFSGFTIR